MQKPCINLQHVSKTYVVDGVATPAITNITLSVQRGEFVAIVGPSGSGKSTLMHILGALDVPTKGTYYLNGQNITNLSDQALAKIRNQQIGYVFQAYNLLPRQSALENVMIPLDYAGQSETMQRQTAERYLAMVGLTDRLHYPPNKLSGGQQQRVAIARALAIGPSIILADEPTGNIGSTQAKEIMAIFRKLNHDLGHTIVMITHEPQIARYAERILTLLDGKITSDSGTTKPKP